MREENIAAARAKHHAAANHLLGGTLGLDDEDWRRPSLLPGWSRGHVGTHLARSAQGMIRVLEGLRSGEERQMYDSTESRNADIEEGAGRSHLALQEDLDQATSVLQATFDSLTPEQWSQQVTMRPNMVVPVAMMPLGRLTEIVLHHIDLDLGFTAEDVEDDTGAAILDWLVMVISQRPDIPPLTLATGEADGQTWHIGTGGPRATGSPGQLATWLTGRGGQVGGTDVAPPPF